MERPPHSVAPNAANPPRANIQLMSYGSRDFTEHDIENIADLPSLVSRSDMVHWLNVDSVEDIALIQQLGELFHLHPLALEDVHHVHQRSKVEEFDGYVFVVVRMATWDDEELATEQLSLFLRDNCIVTFQEGRPGDCLESVRDRIRRGNAQVRNLGADFLMYLLLDASIDSYYSPLDEIGQRLDDLEEAVEAPRVRASVNELHQIRRSLLTLRRAIWPLRDAISSLMRTNQGLVKPETMFHLRDCQDHTVQLIDVAETLRELCSDLRELQYANINQRTNEIMRVLTIIATIFMPLSFVASLYGMNFNTAFPWNMPELNWPLGYVFALGIMGVMFLGMMITFWRWGWIGRTSDLE